MKFLIKSVQDICYNDLEKLAEGRVSFVGESYMEQSVPFAEEAEAGIISAMFKDREVIQLSLIHI